MHNSREDASSYTYRSKAEAEKAGMALGLEGSHSHTTEAGETVFMPGRNHKEFMESQEKKADGRKVKTKFQQARDEMYRKRLKDISYRKYSEKKADHPPSAHKKGKKKSPYMDGVQSDQGTIGRGFDEVL